MDDFLLDRPLRIAIVTENFLPKVDGVTRTLARLLDYLREHGHEAILLGPEGGLTEYAGHQVIGTRGIPLYFYPGLNLNFFRLSFLKNVKAFDPDCIHYVDPIWLSAQAQPLIERSLPDVAAISSYHTNLARYATMYGFGVLVRAMWSLQRRLHGHCMATFCPSPSTREMLHANDFHNVEIWPRGIDTQLFSTKKRNLELRNSWKLQQSNKPEKVVITYVGRISNEKNIHLLIEAFRGLEAAAKLFNPDFPGCKLVLVGDGPARVQLEKSCQDIDVSFAGYRGGEDLAAHYASADIFGFPSHSETFGNVVLEAMASGLPVVGLRAEGVCDLVKDGWNGLLLDVENLGTAESTTAQRDGKATSKSMEELFTPGSVTFDDGVKQYRLLLLRLCLDNELRLRMAQQAKTYAATRGWEEAMECLMTGYRKAAIETRRRRAERLQNAFSRSSSTSSLLSEASFIDIKVEHPPESVAQVALGAVSSRLLFGRPAVKGILRRSTRQAIGKSISLKIQASRETYRELTTAKRPELYGWQIVAFCILLALVWTARRYFDGIYA